MAIIKTLRLQAILLLAFLGAIECKDAVTPAVKGKQGTDEVPIAANVVCTGVKGLKLVCESDSQPSDTDTRAETMMFYKDGDGLGQYQTVTKVTPSASAKDHAEHEIKAAGSELGAADYGVYTCKASTSTTFADGLSQASPDYKVVCKACTVDLAGNTTCTANTAIGPNSYCKPTDGCTCIYGGDLGACDECGDGGVGCTDGDKSKCSPGGSGQRKCVECLEVDNEGCDADSNEPRCDATDPKAAVCTGCDGSKTPSGCGGAKPICDGNSKKCVECAKTSEDADCKNKNKNKPKCTDTGTCVQCVGTEDCKDVTGMPNCVANKCSAETAAPTTGSGTGQTEQSSKASVTSSAGTVTSTACLVIASVVVALMI